VICLLGVIKLTSYLPLCILIPKKGRYICDDNHYIKSEDVSFDNDCCTHLSTNPMKLEQRIVTTIPLEQLWTEAEILSHERQEYLNEQEAQDLLQNGNVSILLASCGLKLIWITPPEALAKFKREIKGHIVNNPDSIVLQDYEDEWCYLASLWNNTLEERILLLETYH
jgi:hypothetical protein